MFSKLAVIYGCLAMLDTHDLGCEISQGRVLITDILGTDLIALLSELSSANQRILAARCVMLWAGKCVTVLKERDLPSHPVLCSKLHGSSSLIQVSPYNRSQK